MEGENDGRIFDDAFPGESDLEADVGIEAVVGRIVSGGGNFRKEDDVVVEVSEDVRKEQFQGPDGVGVGGRSDEIAVGVTDIKAPEDLGPPDLGGVIFLALHTDGHLEEPHSLTFGDASDGFPCVLLLGFPPPKPWRSCPLRCFRDPFRALQERRVPPKVFYVHGLHRNELRDVASSRAFGSLLMRHAALQATA